MISFGTPFRLILIQNMLLKRCFSFLKGLFIFLLLSHLTACYPDTLRQQMAGCDTIEIIFYATTNKAQDTLVIAQKKYIKEILHDFSATKSPALDCPIQAKITFKKARQNYILMEGELALNSDCAYIVYTYQNEKIYRTLALDRIDFFELARKHAFFFERML